LEWNGSIAGESFIVTIAAMVGVVQCKKGSYGREGPILAIQAIERSQWLNETGKRPRGTK